MGTVTGSLLPDHFTTKQRKSAVVGTTADQNIFGGGVAVSLVRCTKASVSLDAHVKFYNAHDAVAGSTVPIMGLPVADGTTLVMYCSKPIRFNNGLSLAAAQEAGNTVTNAPDANTDAVVTGSMI